MLDEMVNLKTYEKRLLELKSLHIECIQKLRERDAYYQSCVGGYQNGYHPGREMQEFNRITKDGMQNCQQRLQEIQQIITNMVYTMEKSREKLHHAMQTAVEIVKDLPQWLLNQKQAQYGCNVSKTENLKPIAEWAQSVTEDLFSVWELTGVVTKVVDEIADGHAYWQQMRTRHLQMDIAGDHAYWQHMKTRLMQLEIDFSNLIHSMLTRTFIVSEQPPMVVKNQQTTLSVRLLCAFANLGLGSIASRGAQKVACRIISEDTAAKLRFSTDTTPIHNDNKLETVGKISGSKRKEESFGIITDIVGAEFSQIKIAIEGRQKHGKDAIKSKSYCMFTAILDFGHRQFPVCVLSLPFVYSCHGNQDEKIWPDILWDMAFSYDLNPIPMIGAKSVTWQKLEPVLIGAFARISSNKGRNRNINYRDLLHLRHRYETGRDPNILSNVTLASLNEDNLMAFKREDELIDCDFTFWAYFYNCAEILHPKSGLTKLNQLWEDNLIYGFVGKAQVEAMLEEQCRLGKYALVIRYSDRFLQGLSVSCCDPNHGIDHQKPFPFKEIVEKLGFPEILDSLKAVANVDYVICGNDTVVPKTEITRLVAVKSFAKAEPDYVDYTDFQISILSSIKPPKASKLGARGTKRHSSPMRSESEPSPAPQHAKYPSLDSSLDMDSLKVEELSPVYESVSIEDKSIAFCSAEDILDYLKMGLPEHQQYTNRPLSHAFHDSNAHDYDYAPSCVGNPAQPMEYDLFAPVNAPPLHPNDPMLTHEPVYNNLPRLI